MRYLIAVLLVVILTVIAFFLGMAVTGRVSRGYPVAEPETALEVAGETKTSGNWAEVYQPVILDDPAIPMPAALPMWYVGTQTGETHITFVYYPTWQDEYHAPKTTTDTLYGWYRSVVYGSSNDIEYVEISVNLATGSVDRIRFETAAPGDYQRAVTQHLYAFLERTDGVLTYRVEGADGTVIQPAAPRPDLTLDADNPLQLYVITWNHLYSLDQPTWQTKALEMPLRFLDDESYRTLKIATRSQGDVRTPANQTQRYLVVALIGLALNGAGLFAVFRTLR